MRQETFGLLRSGDTDHVRVLAQRALVEFREVADAALSAGVDCQRPQHTAFSPSSSAAPGTKPEPAVACFVGEARNVGLRSPGKKEQFVEIALASELGFAQRKAGILCQFAR